MNIHTLKVPVIGSRSEGTLDISNIVSSGLPLHLYSTEKAISPIVVENLYLHILPAKEGIGSSNLCCIDNPSHFHKTGSDELLSRPIKAESRDSNKDFSDIILNHLIYSFNNAKYNICKHILQVCK
jgi:hypothetical protein